MIDKCYSELCKIEDFKEKVAYLATHGVAFENEQGALRYLKQKVYNSAKWRSTRNAIIIRDNGCDLGHEGREIYDMIQIHHINPISMEDVKVDHPKIYDPENLISTCHKTHMIIHYGGGVAEDDFADRKPGDTCPWKK